MAKRTDANQAEIVAALRQVGAMVVDLHIVGHGCPDLLVVWRDKLYLMEVKTRTGKLNQAERDFAQAVAERGVTVHVVRSPEDTLGVVLDNTLGVVLDNGE